MTTQQSRLLRTMFLNTRIIKPQEVKEQASNEKIAAYKDTTKAEMEPYAQDFNAIIEGYEENMVVGFYSEGTIGRRSR